MRNFTYHQEDHFRGQDPEAHAATGCISLAQALVQLNAQLGKTLLLEVMYAENFPDYGALQKSLLAEHLKTDRLQLELLDLRIKAALDLAARVKELFGQTPDAHVLSEETVQLLLKDMKGVGLDWKGRSAWIAGPQIPMRSFANGSESAEHWRRESARSRKPPS